MISATLHLADAKYSHQTAEGLSTLGLLFLDDYRRTMAIGDREQLLRLIDAARDLVDEIDRQERLKAAALVSQS